jgi:hypothetical protein
MRLTPHLPLVRGESLMSWTARLARFHTGLPAHRFCAIVGLAPGDVLRAAPAALDRLSEMTGVARSDLDRTAYLTVESKRTYEFRGHRFDAEFACRSRTTYCPACLLEKSVPNGPCGPHRVGYVNWLYAPVRTCPNHGLPLVRRPNTSYGEDFQDMMVVAPSDAELRRMAASLKPRPVSPLQSYVEARFDAGVGPSWLDGQQIDQAVRATEMIGVCLLHGPHANLVALDETMWDAAGAAGYEATSRGPEGIHEVLGDLLRAYQKKEQTRAQPKAVFGRLHEWAQQRRTRRPRGPIVDVLRAFVLENMVVEEGTWVYGIRVDRPRLHSVATLAKKYRADPRTLNRALVRVGLLPNGDEDRIDPHATVDVEAGEALAERVGTAVVPTRVHERLNCHWPQADALMKHGLLKRILPKDEGATGSLLGVPIAEIREFLARMRSRGVEVMRASEGMSDMVAAAELCRWPAIDIVRLVLEGALTRIELLDPSLGFMSVLVDPVEVKATLVKRQAGDRLSLEEAARAVGVPTWGVTQLLKLRTSEDRPVLRSETETNSSGTARHYFDRGEIDFFLSEHVKLTDLAAERGISVKAMAKEIEQEGVTPILPKTKLGCFMYRRADIYAVKICVSKSGSSTWSYAWGRKTRTNQRAQPKVGYRIAE